METDKIQTQLIRVIQESYITGRRSVVHGAISINPPTDRPFETIQNFHLQNCPLVLYTHGDTIWTVLVASCTAIQMVLEGPLIHHSEVSKQGFVSADLHVPFKTIWGINTVHSYFTIQNHNSEWFQMVHQLVWKRYQK